ncbi:porin family protein [Bacteroides acidifaciens]|uniref:porin family protein n=1 Tax=Bacteroides acidifaciens TaxID=85831 RepID=UPI00267724BA|nr:porin family protein [Bacteroides acidifaciens]
MKKLLSLVAACLLCAGMQAQIVSSRSVSIKSAQKQPSETQWFLRGGLNIMKLTGDGEEDTGSKLGYNFVYGFQKPISTVGTYWGMEFGLGSRGWGDSEDGYKVSQMAHNVQVSPFTFGYKYNITDAVAIDAHLGAYVSFDYVGKYKEEEDGEEVGSASIGDWEDWKRFDAGMNIGVGLWYSRFNLDFTYQRGFIKTWECNTSNVLIRLGVAF